MAITTPATVNVNTASQLYLPAMAGALQAALENCNYLMKWHRPPLASVCYTATDALTRQSIYVFPIMPSADALRYTFEHRIVCSSASQAITITVDETTTYAGAGTTWNNIYSQGITSNGTGGLLTTQVDIDKTVPATATALRVTYTAPAAGSRNDHHVLAYPTPAAPTSGVQTGSGAIPFDDGLIVHADRAAVHTEWINRCKATAAAVLTDRKQNCLSFVQDETTRPYNWSTLGTGHYPLPPARIWLPNQGPQVTLDLRVLAKVDGGATSDLISIRQLNDDYAQSIVFAADNTVKSENVTLNMKGSGRMSYADVEIGVAHSAGQITSLLAVMGYYTPGT